MATNLQLHVVERAVRTGETVETQGERSESLALIKFGFFKGERASLQGEPSAVCVLGRGRILGYANLFKQTAVMSITALTPARICQIPISVVYDQAFVEREFRQYMYRSIGSHIENVAEWASLVRESNISKRLMAAFDLMGQEEGSRSIRIPSHAELGCLVVARRESVARHIALLLKEQKLLKLDRWRVLLRPTAEEVQSDVAGAVQLTRGAEADG